MSVKLSPVLACLFLAAPLQAFGIILDCEVNVDGTYTCVEIHGTVLTEDARRKAKAEQQKYYEQASSQCEYEACIARKAEEMRKADTTSPQ
jgi:hypothetical protein